ncbi:MAG: hypothetical protein DWQ40_12535 [Actinobacteria bacterium]|nr:MAG: hypothetical protein DWQ40_12535 [Actinomycetota bacterium]
MLRLIFKLLRLALVGLIGTAVAAKFMLNSNAEEKTQEIDMVAIFGGEDLRSSASPFYGGKILTMFGGTRLDLRDATPAPTGIYFDVAIVFGGLDLIVPEGWRVEFTGKVFAGGFDDLTATDADPDATVVHIGGFLAMAGARVANRSVEEVSAT